LVSFTPSLASERSMRTKIRANKNTVPKNSRSILRGDFFIYLRLIATTTARKISIRRKITISPTAPVRALVGIIVSSILCIYQNLFLPFLILLFFCKHEIGDHMWKLRWDPSLLLDYNLLLPYLFLLSIHK